MSDAPYGLVVTRAAARAIAESLPESVAAAVVELRQVLLYRHRVAMHCDHRAAGRGAFLGRLRRIVGLGHD